MLHAAMMPKFATHESIDGDKKIKQWQSWAMMAFFFFFFFFFTSKDYAYAGGSIGSLMTQLPTRTRKGVSGLQWVIPNSGINVA